MSGQERPLEKAGTISSEAAKRLALPAVPTRTTGSAEQTDAHTLALSQLRTHVAQALRETVMQTLVATTYLAESPTTSRRELVGYLRQATHELRCVIEHLDTSEAGNERLGGPEPSLAPATRAG